MTARSMDVGNRGVDNSGFGGATDLREVWQETSEVLQWCDKYPYANKNVVVHAHQETAVESLTTLPLDSVVGGPSLGGVCPPAGLSLSSRGRGDRNRIGIGVSIRVGLRNLRRRQRGGGGRSGTTVRRARGDLERHCHREKLRWRTDEERENG